MKNGKSQRFVQSSAIQKNKEQAKMQLPPVYVLTGIAILLMSLIPIAGSVVLVLWGFQIYGDTPVMSVFLIVLGFVLFITLVVGIILFAIYYFTNNSEKKLREIKYKDKDKFEDVFIKCENCGAILLIGSEKCGKCGHIIIKDEEKEKEFNRLKQYFKEQYNFEISEKNIDIINSYFCSKIKTFDYSKGESERNSDSNVQTNVRESVLNVFLFNFKKIILTCSVTMICLIFVFVILGKYLWGL